MLFLKGPKTEAKNETYKKQTIGIKFALLFTNNGIAYIKTKKRMLK